NGRKSVRTDFRWVARRRSARPPQDDGATERQFPAHKSGFRKFLDALLRRIASLAIEACRNRKPKLKSQARRIVEHFDASGMQAGDGCHDAQSQTISGSAATSFQTIEPLEDIVAFGRGYPWAVIGD